MDEGGKDKQGISVAGVVVRGAAAGTALVGSAIASVEAGQTQTEEQIVNPPALVANNPNYSSAEGMPKLAPVTAEDRQKLVARVFQQAAETPTPAATVNPTEEGIRRVEEIYGQGPQKTATALITNASQEATTIRKQAQVEAELTKAQAEQVGWNILAGWNVLWATIGGFLVAVGVAVVGAIRKHRLPPPHP